MHQFIRVPWLCGAVLASALGCGGTNPAEAIPNDGSAAGAGTTAGSAGAAGSAAGDAGSAGSLAGAAGAGGSAAGTAGSAGTPSGGSAGSSGQAGSAGTSGSAAGSGGMSGGGAGGAANQVFRQCRFHFGAIDSFAKKNNLASELDQFTPGWMGQKDTFDMGYVCTEGNAGGALANQVPVIVAYVAAFYSKRHFGRCDCNVTTCGANNDLCHFGAADIQQNLSAILNVYKSYAQGFASCYGTTRPIIFEMEPDFYQYTISGQSAPWSGAMAGTLMSQFVAAIKESLPNAVFSMDISPWVNPSNGSDQGKQWYGYFDMTAFTFVNTSGGSTLAASTLIRSANKMTWAGVSSTTGKPILADTGYGANGVSAGHDPNWDSVSNLNARMADGVVSITQYNPNSNWASVISQLRSQLNQPKFCP